MFDKNKGIILAAVAAAIGLLIGGLIGHFGTPTMTESEQAKINKYDKLTENKWETEERLNQNIINLVDPTNLKNNLEEFSKSPHLAGTARDEELAELIQQRLIKAGFDTADLVPYNVLLSRPDHKNPNLITLINGSGDVVFTSKYKEEELHPDDSDPEFVHAFNAYAPAGDVTTKPGIGVIYVNYGRVEDFEVLENLGIDVAGHLVMARYGKVFRGNKVMHAEQRNATGVILFSDPRDVALEGVEPQEVYPNTFWLPGSGMQRGGTYTIKGDPLTPGWPSTEHAYRMQEEEVPLAKIPCQPIGYDDAKVILEKMGGPSPPSDWVGGLNNISYNLGPQMLEDFQNYTLRLQSHNTRSTIRSYNVIGTIKGDVEPDRYVLVGNHRDAWGYGASDPSSGTAQMLETARVFGELMRSGWRPRRTLVFCSWGAEEYGLIGSTEWVEEHIDKIQERAIVYVNTDTCASGPILNAPGSPLLWDPIVQISKMVPGVRDGETVYDEWAAYHAVRNKSSPEMETLGSGSDYAPFAFYSGIPCLDIWFRTDKNKYDVSTYPYYHTGYETFYMVSTHIDPDFRIHQGCSRIAALTLRYFADSAIIPYSLEKLPQAIEESLISVLANGNRDILMGIYDKVPILEGSVSNFTVAMSNFVQILNQIGDVLDPVMTRAINDLIMKLEQVFILPNGLPGRPLIRHAIFGPSQFDSYGAAGFPGISDLLYKINTLEGEELVIRQKEIRRHISDLTILIQRATSLLKDFHFI